MNKMDRQIYEALEGIVAFLCQVRMPQGPSSFGVGMDLEAITSPTKHTAGAHEGGLKY